MTRTLPPFASRVAPDLSAGLIQLDRGQLPLDQPELVLAILRGGSFAEKGRSAQELRAQGVILQHHTVARDNGDTLRLSTYRPADADGALPMVLHMHGGGLITGTVESEESTAIRMVRQCGVMVASVDYRLAPEHPSPAAQEDCYAALAWLHKNAATLGGQADFIAVSGTSAGAGLAAALTLMSRERGGPAIALQILASPMLDDRTAIGTRPEFSGIPGWSLELNAFAWRCILGEDTGTARVSPYAAPARAEDLGGLPPAVITLGALELFREEILAYATRLSQAGVAVELHLYPGAYHGWERMNPDASSTHRAARLRDDTLCAAIARHQSRPQPD